MKTKVLYFLLGAGVATLAYMAGSISSTAQHSEYGEYDLLTVKRLWVKENMAIATDETSENKIGPSLHFNANGEDAQFLITHNSANSDNSIMLTAAKNRVDILLGNIDPLNGLLINSKGVFKLPSFEDVEE